MKKIYFGILAAGLLTMAGCSNEDFDVQGNEGVKTITSLTATLGETPVTRAYLNRTGSEAQVVWDEHESIGVISDMDSEGTHFHSNSTNGVTALFQGDPVTGSRFYAFYPSGIGNDRNADNPYVLELDFYSRVTNDDNYNFYIPMVASASATENTFEFKQTVGLIHVEIGGLASISDVSLSANANEQIAGQAYIDLTDSEPVLKIYADDSHRHQNNVGFGFSPDKRSMSENETKDIYFALPPVNLRGGFTLRVHGQNADGESISLEKIAAAPLNVERGNVYNYALVNVGAELELIAEQKAQLAVEQKATLKSIWDSLMGNEEGTYGPYPDSWDDANDLSSWQYVRVENSTGYVTALEIRGRQMKGQIPASIGNLDGLTQLYLDDLSLTGTIPEEIGNLMFLSSLSLRGNQLEGAFPASMYNLRFLRDINVEMNNFDFTITKQMQESSVMWQRLTNRWLNPQRSYWDANSNSRVEHRINVEGAMTSITLNAAELILNVGDTYQLAIKEFEPADADATNVSWAYWTVTYNEDGGSSWRGNDDVVSVDENGLVTVNGTGDAYVRVTDNDSGANAECHISVLTEEQKAYQQQLKSVLMDLYNATDGENWLRQDNWCSNEPLTSWEGLEFRNGKLIRVNLNSNNLKGEIPASFWTLTDLQDLNLGGNARSGEDTGLTGSIPSAIGNLTSLREFNIVGNYFSGIIPEELYTLTNLVSLYLGSNELEGTLSESVGNLTNLRMLDVTFNQLTGSIPQSIGNLSQLRWIQMQNNHFTGTIPESLTRLSNLQRIDVSSNHLSLSTLSESLQAWLDSLSNGYNLGGQTQQAGD